MFRLLRLFFTLFGVVSFLFWSGLGYVWVTDRYGVQTATKNIITIFQSVRSTTPTIAEPVAGEASSVNDTAIPASGVAVTALEEQVVEASPSIGTNEQRAALEVVGIDTGVLPHALTTEQIQCMNEKIGVERVAAISAGAVPTPLEVIAAVSCL
jgi:hypothetical protein